jgi:hypothetical protein
MEIRDWGLEVKSWDLERVLRYPTFQVLDSNIQCPVSNSCAHAGHYKRVTFAAPFSGAAKTKRVDGCDRPSTRSGSAYLRNPSCATIFLYRDVSFFER